MFLIIALLKTAAFIITACMLVAAGNGNTEEYDVKSPESCRINFTVLSDSHIVGNNFARPLQNVQKNNSGNDAVVFLGDNTMNGHHIENLLFHAPLLTCFR